MFSTAGGMGDKPSSSPKFTFKSFLLHHVTSQRKAVIEKGSGSEVTPQALPGAERRTLERLSMQGTTLFS